MVHMNIDPGIKEDEIIITIKEMNSKVERILSIINEEVDEVIPLQKVEQLIRGLELPRCQASGRSNQIDQ